MTWTYGGDPSANDRDEVRFLVGDTDTTDQLVTDEEIAYSVSDEATNYNAAAKIARAIAAKFSRKVDKSVGDLKQAYSQRVKQYLELAERLEGEAVGRTAKAYAGGISKSDKETVEEDSDRVEPAFEIGMHDPEGELHEINREPEDEI